MRQALYAVLEALCRLLFTYDFVGEEHVPAQGPAVVASNHPSGEVVGIFPEGRRSRTGWMESSLCEGAAGWLATRLFPYHRPPGVLAHPAVISGSAAGGSPPVDSRGRST